MNAFGGFTTVKVGTIPAAKLRKALEGNAVRLTKAELTGDRVMVVNKLNAKAIKGAQTKGKGLTTHFSSGEAAEDLQYHSRMGAGMEGGSLWSWIKDKAVPWVKKNWDVLKPVVSRIADIAMPAAATAFGAPELGVMGRSALKQLTGVGVSGKGSDAMKAKMAALRARRKSGGSFRMP